MVIPESFIPLINRHFSVSLLIAGLIGFAPGVLGQSDNNEAQHPRLDGNVLDIPVVTALDSAFHVALTLVGGTEPPELILTFAEELTNPDLSNSSFFEDDLLTVRNAHVGDQQYWAHLDLVAQEPAIRFRLAKADFDDEDDDNDGIPDTEDPLPYEASTDVSPDPAGVAGTWFFRFEITSDVTGTACEFDDKVTFSDALITYDESEEMYFISNGLFNGPLNVTNQTVSYSGSYPEDGGTTSSNVSLQLQSANFMSGIEIWTWSSAGEVPCINIQSSVTASR